MIPPLDLPPDAAERLRHRARRVLAAQARRSRIERQGAALVARVEPAFVGAFAAALVLWALGTVF